MFSIGMRKEMRILSLVTPGLVAPPLSLPAGQAMPGGEYGSPTTCTVRSAHGPAAATAAAGAVFAPLATPTATGAVAAAPGAAAGACPATGVVAAAVAGSTFSPAAATVVVSRAMVGTSV